MPDVSPRSIALARVLSILGHPVLLMPIAVPLAARVRGAPAAVVQLGMAVAIAVALAVALYSLWQVRAGRWRHVDASVPAERRQLNRFLIAVMGLGVAVLGWRLAALAWPVWPAVAALAVLVVAVAWSRRVLGRHTRAEVLVGALLGGGAGLGFNLVVVRLAGG